VVFLLPMAAKIGLSAVTQRFTPHTDPKTIVAYCEPILEQLRQFFAYACSRAAEHFAERGWTPDVNLFSYEVRKDVFERLRALGADITELEENDLTTFSLERMALSGLLLKLPLIHLRIRKSKDHEIPSAGSEQLLGFYNWNLFAFDELPLIEGDKEESSPLHLILLWNLDENWKITNFWLACPRGESAGEVKCFWQEPVSVAIETYDDNAQEFRAAFDEANSDVPLSPKEKTTTKRASLATGSDKKQK
jgi:hypothetical protein